MQALFSLNHMMHKQHYLLKPWFVWGWGGRTETERWSEREKERERERGRVPRNKMHSLGGKTKEPKKGKKKKKL